MNRASGFFRPQFFTGRHILNSQSRSPLAVNGFASMCVFGGRKSMADRKPILGESPARPELDRLLAEAKSYRVSDAELQEQRVSFAYGNAPQNSGITKNGFEKLLEP